MFFLGCSSCRVLTLDLFTAHVALFLTVISHWGLCSDTVPSEGPFLTETLMFPHQHALNLFDGFLSPSPGGQLREKWGFPSTDGNTVGTQWALHKYLMMC